MHEELSAMEASVDKIKGHLHKEKLKGCKFVNKMKRHLHKEKSKRCKLMAYEEPKCKV
jgi:hypothetical protein